MDESTHEKTLPIITPRECARQRIRDFENVAPTANCSQVEDAWEMCWLSKLFTHMIPGFCLAYFLERVLPVAEASNVKLAAHPDDAPIPEFMGVARILSSLDGLKRLVESFPSPSNGLDFCQGTISEMPGVDVIKAIHYFGSRGKIFFAHFRDTRGTVPKFTEVFMDDGDTDMLAAIQAYQDVGFDGLIRADHTPWMIGDNRYAHRGFAFQIGYMKGLIQVAESTAVRTLGKEG